MRGVKVGGWRLGGGSGVGGGGNGKGKGLVAGLRRGGGGTGGEVGDGVEEVSGWGRCSRSFVVSLA